MAQDILGKNLYEATNFGGSSNISKYERIGSGDAYILNMYFTPDSQTYLYPLVSAIDIGVTSSVSKNYSVEVKTTPNAKWQTLFINVSDITTTDFIRYKLSTSTRLSNIRVVYKGDYNTLQRNGGTLTIAGIDDWSDVTEVQVSHFSDFRDADDFVGSNTRGWAHFTEGSTVYDWNITNEAGLWQKHSGITYGQPKLLTSPSSSQAAIFGDNEINVSQGSLIRNSTNTSLVTGDTILCTTVHNSVIYAGTRLGYLLQSSRGDYWTIVNTKNPLDSSTRVLLPPITSLVSHAGSLYIGTKKTTLKNASLYKYQDKRIILVSNSFTENTVSFLATNKGLLYIATSGLLGSKNGSVYTYDGSDINNIELSGSEFDETLSMVYSTALDTIVAGFSNGTVYKLTYDSNSNPSTWISLNEFGTDSKIVNISDDTSGKFLFVSLTDSFHVYVKNLDVWYEGVFPKNTENYPNLTYKQFAAAGSTDYKNDRDFSFIQRQTLQSSLSNVNFNTLKPSGIGASYYTATLDFLIKSPNTTNYQFLLKTNSPARLSIDDNVLTPSSLWTTENNITTNTTTDYYSTSTVEFVEDELYKVKLELAVKEISAAITPTFSLLWKDNATDTGSMDIVPNTYIFRPTNITSISNVVNNYVASSLDGFSYTFSPSFYESNKKYTYVRLKDEAGNYHNYQLEDGSIPYASLDDFIILGAEDDGVDPPPAGTGKINFTPATITAGNTSEATLIIAEAKSTTSVFAITTDGNSTSATTNVTVAAGLRSSDPFTITVPTTIASTITSTTVTATLSDEVYTGTLNINPADGGGPPPTTKTTTVIYQVKPALSSTVDPITYKSGSLDTIYSPKRRVRSTGNYVSRPFYVPTLTRWDTMSVLVLNKYNLNTALGLDAGTEVNVYVRTADSSSACLIADWSTAYSKSYINNSTAPASAETLSIDLQAYSGKFLQFYLELVTATQGDSPEVLAVTVSYSAATGSYFFTKTFDSTDYSTTSPIPTFRRGLLTSNQDKKDGEIVYGYTTDDRSGYKYDFARYTIIEPNKSFELETPSSTIKFAILLTSIDGDPSIVYDFAVQLDAGDEDMNFMPEL
jgi:hypothetical protein